MNYEDIYITKLEQAPSELVLAINDVQPEQKVMSIASTAGLTETETETLSHIVDMYIYGALQASELAQQITTQIPKLQPVLSHIVDTINNTIAIPIQKEVQNQKDVDEPLEPTLSAEELDLESDKPEFWQNEPDEETYTEEDIENLRAEGVYVDDLEEIPDEEDIDNEQTNSENSISEDEHKTLQKAGIVVEGAPIAEKSDSSLDFIKMGFSQPTTSMHTDSNHVIPKITKTDPVVPGKVIPKPPKKDLYLEPIV